MSNDKIVAASGKGGRQEHGFRGFGPCSCVNGLSGRPDDVGLHGPSVGRYVGVIWTSMSRWEEKSWFLFRYSDHLNFCPPRVSWAQQDDALILAGDP